MKDSIIFICIMSISFWLTWNTTQVRTCIARFTKQTNVVEVYIYKVDNCNTLYTITQLQS